MLNLKSSEVELLIELVRVKKALYDKAEKLYRNVEWKDKMWREIATEIGVDGKFYQYRFIYIDLFIHSTFISEKICRTAWRSLRDQYIKCLKDSKGTGKAAPDDRKQYKYFDNLSFLRESCEPRK